ncbi:hypothetical protein [Xanthomonas sacchari]|uniref:hypothetical protein n=1 Tax=Xanthomonas sacchari TaxID=56458 RepID=UPI003B21692C
MHSERIDKRFWFEHRSGIRLYPYRLKCRDTGCVAFRVARPGTGANQNANQIQLEDVEEVFRHVFALGYSVRMSALDPRVNGLYSKDGYSIVRTSES